MRPGTDTMTVPDVASMACYGGGSKGTNRHEIGGKRLAGTWTTSTERMSTSVVGRNGGTEESTEGAAVV